MLDFGSPWDLQNRAETQARASFSLIRLNPKNVPNGFKKLLFGRPWGYQNHKKPEKNASGKTVDF